MLLEYNSISLLQPFLFISLSLVVQVAGDLNILLHHIQDCGYTTDTISLHIPPSLYKRLNSQEDSSNTVDEISVFIYKPIDFYDPYDLEFKKKFPLSFSSPSADTLATEPEANAALRYISGEYGSRTTFHTVDKPVQALNFPPISDVLNISSSRIDPSLGHIVKNYNVSSPGLYCLQVNIGDDIPFVNLQAYGLDNLPLAIFDGYKKDFQTYWVLIGLVALVLAACLAYCLFLCWYYPMLWNQPIQMCLNWEVPVGISMLLIATISCAYWNQWLFEAEIQDRIDVFISQYFETHVSKSELARKWQRIYYRIFTDFAFCWSLYLLLLIFLWNRNPRITGEGRISSELKSDIRCATFAMSIVLATTYGLTWFLSLSDYYQENEDTEDFLSPVWDAQVTYLRAPLFKLLKEPYIYEGIFGMSVELMFKPFSWLVFATLAKECAEKDPDFPDDIIEVTKETFLKRYTEYFNMPQLKSLFSIMGLAFGLSQVLILAVIPCKVLPFLTNGRFGPVTKSIEAGYLSSPFNGGLLLQFCSSYLPYLAAVIRVLLYQNQRLRMVSMVTVGKEELNQKVEEKITLRLYDIQWSMDQIQGLEAREDESPTCKNDLESKSNNDQENLTPVVVTTNKFQLGETMIIWISHGVFFLAYFAISLLLTWCL
ncbi:hypothetical protein WICPIJ_003521 [Wickerhamomyces pijperi]|uniref:Uncharacterized protein n=1 Tax=Wickerhamomyces pijperi TaxID=599730 RepID=A0A9P8TNS9_WICPI|nr:hypothetical protein WICPIJ_003521 [Wickerhamomyces pijperi]